MVFYGFTQQDCKKLKKLSIKTFLKLKDDTVMKIQSSYECMTM